jgi:isoquinoline 1-oxidoreductase subunit alpha
MEVIAVITLTVNGRKRSVDVDPEMPLAWVVRDRLGLQGTHISCAAGICGACTVHINGAAVRSCQVPVGSVAGQKITTIEGLSPDASHPVQQAWIAEDVVQCGYCQSGFIMAVAALLQEKPEPSDADIDTALTNICRCGTYARIRKAIHRAAALQRGAAP